MDPLKVIAVVLTSWAAAWAVTILGAPAGAALIIGLIVGTVTAALIRR